MYVVLYICTYVFIRIYCIACATADVGIHYRLSMAQRKYGYIRYARHLFSIYLPLTTFGPSAFQKTEAIALPYLFNGEVVFFLES